MVVIAGALMLLGADALSSLETGEMTLRSTAEVLNLVGQDSMAVQGLLEGSVPALGSYIAPVMATPAWVPLGVLGMILALIFRVRD